ncbi:MAG: GNAT family N-acetyltransferase [Caldilineaceae bacterium]|nr:GNAT family N-acetyltransferase [Caldilineaceae bacterium]
MSRSVWAKRIDSSSADWPDRLREMRRRLGERPTLLPHHFLEAVLPKIGGACIHLFRDELGEAESPCGYAFLLPRNTGEDGATFTLRYEHVAGSGGLDADAVSRAVGEILPPEQRSCFYLPEGDHTFTPTHIHVEGVDCGRPDAEEAAEVRRMQRSIWHSAPDGLYPSDLHSDDGGMGCSLVARVDGELAGFLLGFFRVPAGPPGAGLEKYRQDLQLESQLLAVAPGKRRRRIGQLLKRLQARQAVGMGIDLINWTTDPLLFANALLNFTRLGAVACEFQPSLYSFRNELNRVIASRLNLLWAIRSKRVQRALRGSGQLRPWDVEADPGLTVVNEGGGSPIFGAESARIAIEVPSDWVRLQRDDMPAAQRWRDVSNRLLEHYLGSQPGRYYITGTGIAGTRRYVVGERVDDRLLDRLFTPAE